MHIHSVKKDESVFSIAREYAVSPMSIVDNNGLDDPRRLAVGQELLILTPSRSYTARGGDSVSALARRFGIKRSEIFANNPALLGKEALYDGQSVAIKYSDAKLGMGSSNGYLFRGCTEEALCRALPYITYLTIGALKTENGALSPIFAARDAVKRARSEGKIPLLRAYDISSPEFYSDTDGTEKYAEALIKYAREEEYGGLTLSAPSEGVDTRAYQDFVIRLRRRLIGCDLILFSEATVGRDYGYADYADGCILSYDKLSLGDMPSLEEGERKVYRNYAEESESSKTFMDISSFGLTEDGYIDYAEAVSGAIKQGATVTEDEATGVCSYFHGGRRGKGTVRFESLKSMKAKLEMLGELGYMGISFDIMRCPIAHLMMYNALFSEISYASVFSKI